MSEERAFQLYSAVYPWMNADNYMTFEEFKRPRVQDTRTAEEILDDTRRLFASV